MFILKDLQSSSCLFLAPQLSIEKLWPTLKPDIDKILTENKVPEKSIPKDLYIESTQDIT